MKKIKYVFIAFLLMVAAGEGLTLAHSTIAERKAKALTNLLGVLKPGYTTMDSAKALFQSHGVDVSILNSACGNPKGPCDSMSPGVGNYKLFFVRRDPPLGFYLLPFPPFKRALLDGNLYFVNGILDSINVDYRVGTTRVAYSRYAGDYNFRSSEWNHATGDMVVSIRVASSGPAFDLPFPRFDMKYMYTLKCVDARSLWPTAPAPTAELHGAPSCR